LSLILQRLSPDIEERRKSGLKLYSEKVVRLRELENQMLSSINAVAGNILDDDKMVEGMEILSREGSQLEDQLRSCSDSMGRVEAELQKYEEMACLCRKLFILLLSVREISFLYEFSADYFIRILEKALSLLEVGSGRENDKLENLKKGLLTETAARSLRRMSSEDKTLFCLLLGRLFHGDDYPANFASTDEMRQYLYATLGKDFNYEGRGIMDLAAVTTNDLSCKIPLLICSAPGFDISNRVEHLAADQGKDLAAIAMGSSECFPTAEGMLSMAAKNGSWLLLKNCHLCLEWLQDKFFVKYFSLGNSIHEHFRLFLTSEISPIPISIVRLCDVMVAEAPTGLKASLSRFLSCINPVRFKTAIRNRLYLLVAWLHAVLQERLRYIPSGWSEKYDFTESDIMYALDVIDELYSHASKGRPHVDPVNLPWLALRTILSKDIYGGRLSRDIDQQRLEDLVNSIFQPEAYDLNFKLGKDDDAPLLPEGNTLNDYWSWIQGLPTKTPPSWIGLNITEEVQLSKTVAVSICSKVQRIEFMLNEQDRG
jgi:dynein heavy chain 1